MPLHHYSNIFVDFAAVSPNHFWCYNLGQMRAILSYIKDGRPAQETAAKAIRAGIGKVSGPYWLSLTSPTEEDLAWLGEKWGFHPLTLEDCRTYNPRPKLEEYSGYLFLVLHEVSLRRELAEATDIQLYFSQEYLITVHRGESVVLDRIRERGIDLSKGVDFLFYRLMSQFVEDYFDIVDAMDERIENVEEQVVTRPGRQVLHRIFGLRKNLVSILRLAAPFREILHVLESHDYPYIKPEHQLYFRDVRNSLVYIHEMIETQRDLASGALEAYMSSINNNLNEVLKRLTLIATIFMPISFIAAFFGMNFRSLPFDDAVVMAATLAVIVALPLGMLVWFKTRGWV